MGRIVVSFKSTGIEEKMCRYIETKGNKSEFIKEVLKGNITLDLDEVEKISIDEDEIKQEKTSTSKKKPKEKKKEEKKEKQVEKKKEEPVEEKPKEVEKEVAASNDNTVTIEQQLKVLVEAIQNGSIPQELAAKLVKPSYSVTEEDGVAKLNVEEEKEKDEILNNSLKNMDDMLGDDYDD